MQPFDIYFSVSSIYSMYSALYCYLDDHSRVRLKGGNPKDIGRDYINANYIDASVFISLYFYQSLC